MTATSTATRGLLEPAPADRSGDIGSLVARMLEQGRFAVTRLARQDVWTGETVGWRVGIDWADRERGELLASGVVQLARRAGASARLASFQVRAATGILGAGQHAVIETDVRALEAAPDWMPADAEPESFVFEVTQADILRNPEASIVAFDKLAALGSVLAIDGYDGNLAITRCLQVLARREITVRARELFPVTAVAAQLLSARLVVKAQDGMEMQGLAFPWENVLIEGVDLQSQRGGSEPAA